MLRVRTQHAECYYAECHYEVFYFIYCYAERTFARCHFAECRGATLDLTPGRGAHAKQLKPFLCRSFNFKLGHFIAAHGGHYARKRTHLDWKLRAWFRPLL